MKRRFYRDRRERRRRWARKNVSWYQKLKFFTEADVKRFRDYFWEVYSRNLKDPVKSFTTDSSEPLISTWSWPDPRLKLEFNPSRPSTIPPIPSEPRRREAFWGTRDLDEEIRNSLGFKKLIPPKYKKLWRLILRFLRIHVQKFYK